MPLGGRGRSFVDKGFTFPKPLVEISGRPMVEIAVENLTPSGPHQFVFICRREHLDRYALKEVLELLSPGCKIIAMNNETGGALCTVLLGIESIVPEDELIIANGDQYLSASIDDFLHSARASSSDGCIVVFPSTHPKWSYVRIREDGEVEMVAEKRPISRSATAGIYYFRRGHDFLDAAERMMLKGTKTGGEFFVAPVYNELVLAGKRITAFALDRHQMHSLGTPEDVEAFAKLAATLPEFSKHVHT